MLTLTSLPWQINFANLVTFSEQQVQVMERKALHPKTMLLMSDSRSLDKYDYHQLAYTINSNYAKRHDYSIRYFHTPCLDNHTEPKECIACIHPTLGGRMSPWCKLLAINDTMYRYSDFDRIVYIDSDAFVNRLDSSFRESYFNRTLNMFWNKPHNVPPVCTGIQFWQNTRLGREMIAAWWDSATAFNTQHDYEQSVFHESTAILGYVSSIGIIQEDVREYKKENKGNPFFRHITMKKEEARLRRMEAFIAKFNISSQVISELK
jgi:hypothetical protein